MMTDKDSSAYGTDNRPSMLEENDYESWRIPLEGGVVPPPRNKRDEEFTKEDNRNELARRIFNILNQNETGREIWVNLELLKKGSGQTLKRRKEALFDEFERFRANGNELIQDSFVRFHKLVNDMKVTQLDIPTHQLNTKFANNLPSYWGKYVTHAKNNMNMSTAMYVELFTHLRTYEEHALKSLKKKEQSFAVVDPLTCLANITPTHSTTSSVTVPTPQSSCDSHNDAMLATMNQIANLLSGLQKQRDSGNTGTKGIQTTGSGMKNSGKKWYLDKALLMQAKDKGVVLDVEAEAFLADVECTAPYDQPLVLTTTNLFEAKHEDAYDSDVDEGPHASAAFMANLSSIGVEAIPTVVSADEADKQSMIAVLQRMHTKIAGYVRVNDEHKLVNATLTAELERCKIEMQALERNKVKHDLDMAIVERNKRNAELEEENVMLKSTHKSKVVSIKNLQQESKQMLSEKKTLKDKYLEEIVVLTNANKKIAVQKAKIATLNAKTIGNKTSGTTKPANPKVIALGMNKICTGTSKPASKSNAWIYRKLPAESAKGEKVEEHIRNLNKNNRVDSHVKRSISVKNLNAVCGACHECLISSNHDNCLVYSVKSVNRKQPKAKDIMRTTKKVWRPKVVTSVKPMWNPTGRYFTLFDSYPLTRILEPTVEPRVLSSGVSSSTKIPMLSKFVAVTLGMESWFQRNPCYV
nr:hypothetical protein [Tanacetum cinerariifolium]